MRYKTKTFQLIENYLKTCCDKCFRAHDVYDYIVANEMKVNISIIHIKKESMDSIIAMLEKDYKFFLDCDISTIGGLCKTCMMKKELK